MSKNVSTSLSEENGKIYMNDERMILTSSSVFGTLRKDLMDNIGEQHVKGFLIRYGWNLGVNDAKRVINEKYSSLEEILRQGPVLHMMKGYTDVKKGNLHIDYADDGSVKNVHVEGAWISSYEAEEHVKQFGIAELPVCHTLIGYASGYYSEICRHTVIFKEVSCRGTGDNECYYVGKTLSEWNGEVDDELKFYENITIAKELEKTYEQLLNERNNLSKTFAIHKRLTEELLNSNNLQSLADVVFRETNCPFIIEDLHFQNLVYSGLSPESFEEVELDFKYNVREKIQNKHYFYHTREASGDSHRRLMTPIMLEKKRFGYCSFIYKEEEELSEVDQMILERVATVCSLFLLNEKNAFEATERMKGHFLEQILNSDLLSEKEILKRGSYINLNLNRPYYIVALKYNEQKEMSKNELLFHEEVIESISQYFKKHSGVLIGQRDGNIVLLIQVDTLDDQIDQLCNELLNYLKNIFPSRLFKIGVSTEAEDIQQAAEYKDEALTALQMTTSTNQLLMFDDLGVVGILLHSKNKDSMKQKAKQLLGPLYENNDDYKDFLKTLYVFLMNGGNLEKSMEELSLSMSGLRYRIKKLETILEKDLRDPAVAYQLLLTLQVLIAEGEVKME